MNFEVSYDHFDAYFQKILFKIYIFMSGFCVRGSSKTNISLFKKNCKIEHFFPRKVSWSRIATSRKCLCNVPVLDAGGKPSTWFPPGRLVEFIFLAHAKEIIAVNLRTRSKVQFTKRRKLIEMGLCNHHRI